jgi:hypothetical protein
MRRQELTKDEGDLMSIRADYYLREREERGIGLLEQRTVVREACGKGIDRRGGANVPQCEHRTVTLKQW